MTRERVIEMAKAICNMHGLAESREQEKFLFDGKIFFYNMEFSKNRFNKWFYSITVRITKDIIYNIWFDEMGFYAGINGQRWHKYYNGYAFDEKKHPMPIKAWW